MLCFVIDQKQSQIVYIEEEIFILETWKTRVIVKHKECSYLAKYKLL